MPLKIISRVVIQHSMTQMRIYYHHSTILIRKLIRLSLVVIHSLFVYNKVRH